MTRDEVMNMARAAGMEPSDIELFVRLARFAEMVAAKEREACAKLADAHESRLRDVVSVLDDPGMLAMFVAKADSVATVSDDIRARSNGRGEG